MLSSNSLVALALALVATAQAWDAPLYPGFSRRWQETFVGSAGSLPNEGNWEIIDKFLGVNNELQTYRRDNRNVQLSGGATLQLVPLRDDSAREKWTSGRLESRYVFQPQDGGLTRVESLLRFGSNGADQKQGIWPAFWLLGASIRHGVQWPRCGEIDIMENINGKLTGYGVLHCDVFPGGICNEGSGIGGSIGMPDQSWHTWRVEFDRRNPNWKDQSITWYMDGRPYHTVTGSRINNFDVWASVCHSDMFFIVNVAVGGNWPGYPDGRTRDGFGSMMEVAYVAHYSTPPHP